MDMKKYDIEVSKIVKRIPELEVTLPCTNVFITAALLMETLLERDDVNKSITRRELTSEQFNIVKKALGQILCNVTLLSGDLGISLNEVAISNLEILQTSQGVK